MSEKNKSGIPKITWTVREDKKVKDKETLAVMWIVAITLAIVIFIVSKNYISSLVVLAAAFALYGHYMNMSDTRETSYTLTLKGVRVNNLLYPYKNIRRYNITKNEDGKTVLVLDLISVLTPDIVAPLDGVDEEEVDFFLSRFVEEDPDMQIPLTHVLAERLGM